MDYNSFTYMIIYILALYALFRSVLNNNHWIDIAMNVTLHILWGYLWPLFAIYFTFLLVLDNPHYMIY
jgi:hypothetical protein